MALPIAIGDMIDLAKLAYNLWNSCNAAKGEFKQVGTEVYAMRTAIELVRVTCQDSNIIKIAGGKSSPAWQVLQNHIRNCKGALLDVEVVLTRYTKMSSLDRIKWAMTGKSEVAGLKANLSSFTTQLDSIIGVLTLKGVGVLAGAQASPPRYSVGHLGCFEEELEKNSGNDEAAVQNVMRHMKSAGISHDTASNVANIFSDYAREVRRSNASPDSRRASTPDPPQERNRPSSFLNSGRRSSPAGAIKHANNRPPKRVSFTKSSGPKRRNDTLECWLIQIKSADAMFLNFKRYIKEKQVRGQWKLEQMARQFQSCPNTSKLANNHELVKWVLADRKEAEKNPDYTWRPYTAKIERKSPFFLGLGIEEQAMVIIKRQMTPEAQRRADEEARIKAEKSAALKKKRAEEIARKIAAESAEHKAARAQKIKDDLDQERKKGKGRGNEKRDNQEDRRDKGRGNPNKERKKN